jgi:hypothetical protein
MRPFTVRGFCGEVSLRTGKASGPKLYTVPGRTIRARLARAAAMALSSIGSASSRQLR